MYNLSCNHNVLVRRGLVGTEKLRIGELADKTNVTKRTIDYYTNLGLLKAERSASNYRYYDPSSIERIEFIEKRKQDGMSLDDIKKEIIAKYSEEVDVLELRLKIKGLEKEVSEILAQLEKTDKKKYDDIKKKISHESLSLIQTLLLLLS
ncbi:DNA-binding transcriptional MerR regulator [Bacillus thermophilus]|uniref:DNA-binding transcriptional MerR regulator n=1 Tax=Siminovitchia thermophila TaxID=1245522 RepID=A0ABS2R4Y3_9BACI|nr:MerR family transcriptional regulator [Siminovitchia thermophila]MBM7714681.1 DNA-binding transcriptional MerR regulator [Siminovitchia thermophila]